MRARDVFFLSMTILGLACSCATHRPEKTPEVLLKKKEAGALVAAGRYGQALPVLRSLAATLEDDPEVLSMLAEALWKTGDFTAALGYFEASMRLDYTNWRTHMLLALMLVEKGKTGRALTEFELGVRYGPDKAVAHYNYGLALYEIGKRAEALDQWKAAFQLEADNPDYAAALGMALSEIEGEEALQYFEKAGQLGGDAPGFHHNFGLLLERLGETARARDHFIKALEKKPHDERYIFSLAGVRMRLKEYGKAVPLWKELIERSYNERASRIYLAKCYLETGSYEEAIGTLEEEAASWQEAMERGELDWRGEKPGLDKAMEILALSYRKTGRMDMGLKYMRRAVEINPGNANYRVNYGAFLAESGMINEAKVQWEKALELDPGNEVARKNLLGAGKQQ